MNRRYSLTDYSNNRFYQLERVLFEGNYKVLSNNDRIVYTILKDRFELSIKNGWVDEEDNIYFYFRQDSLAIQCCISRRTVQACIDDLVKAELLESVRQGMNKPNRLYLLKPIAELASFSPKEQVEETKKTEERPANTDKYWMRKNCASGQAKIAHSDAQNLRTINTEYNYTELSISSSEELKNYYQNILNEKNTTYKVGGRKIIIDDELREGLEKMLDEKFINHMLITLHKNQNGISAMKPFLFACLYNYASGAMRLPDIRASTFGFEQREYDFEQLEKELCNN